MMSLQVMDFSNVFDMVSLPYKRLLVKLEYYEKWETALTWSFMCEHSQKVVVDGES